jgi:hypothetical protein
MEIAATAIKRKSDLGVLVEERVVYEAPSLCWRLRSPLKVYLWRGEEWFFAEIKELELFEEGRTPEQAVANCFETLFEVYVSYRSTKASQLSKGANQFLHRLESVVASVKKNNCRVEWHR